MHTHTQPPAAASRGRSGQAAIELVLGILMIIILFGGGMQYLKIAGVQRNMVTSLRGEAGVNAQTVGIAEDLADYLLTWDSGEDEIAYTADDQPITSPATVLTGIADRSVRNDSDWGDYIRDLPNPTPIYDLHNSPLTMQALSLVKAEEAEVVYTDEPGFRLIYGTDHVHVKHAVWLPVMTGPSDPDDPGMRGGFL